ncbi:MAG: hypothetical protein IJN29_14950 [Akkermansia sp.]|nr:hypothetical protein [Akkermansia sp.]
MKRLAFNGGEISPAMSLRSDMDAATRSCSLVTNWNIHATGGISRRRGMRHLITTQEPNSRLIPYRYSADQTALIEIAPSALHIRNSDTAAIITTFTPDAETPWQYPDLTKITWLQINALLLILSPHTPVMQLECDDSGDWSFTPFHYISPPWQTEDYRDIELTLTPLSQIPTSETNTTLGTTYTPSYTPVEPDPEDDPAEILPEDTQAATGDILRASYYTTRQEAFQKAAEAASGLTILTALTTSSDIPLGQKIAWQDPEDTLDQHYICTKDWTGNTDFTTGYISPANYPDNFDRADSSAGFDTIEPITELSAGKSYKRGAKLIFRSGYYDLYYCIRPFSGTEHFDTSTNPANYPRHFTRGIPIGPAIPAGGKWQFYCSGTWYGTYEIRRNHETGALTEQWEHLGESISSIGSTANNLITGNEEQEECFLRLFLTQIRLLSPSDPTAGWPPDYCQNRLIVQSYRRNMQLTVLADGTLQDTSPIITPLTSPITTTDWSWCAFNSRYGYPALAALHESRLVLAATSTQPQTLWLSQSDDLNNFTTGDLDTSGIHLTMNTSTQAPICWMHSRHEVIMLGTMDAEWIIKPSTGGAGLTPQNARAYNQGNNGSMPIPAIAGADRVLYTERGGGRVYEYAYRYESDSYTSTDLTIFADHIAPGEQGITGGTILKKPYTSIIFTTASGNLLLCTYNTMHNVHAWHRYTTQGHIQSVAALPNGIGADRLYLITHRNNSRRIEIIDDTTETYLDALEQYPYTSTLETTAFSSPEHNDRKTKTATVEAYFLPPTPPPSSLQLSTGGTYKPNDRHTITPGWNQFTATANWRHMPYIGIKCTGPHPCTILAMQLE